MPTEHDLIKRLLNDCLEFEIESECLHRVLKAVRQTNPEIPALEALQLARLDSRIRDTVTDLAPAKRRS